MSARGVSQGSLDFEAPLPFGDEPIRCESVDAAPTAPPATMGAWADRQNRAAKRRESMADAYAVDEFGDYADPDFGGAFDGFTVSSDADSGL